MKNAMRRVGLAVTVLGFLAGAAGHAKAGLVIDQKLGQPQINASILVNSQSIWQQEVTVGVSGLLMGVDILPQGVGVSGKFFINAGAGWQSDPNDYETTFTSTVSNNSTSSEQWFRIDTSAAGLHLNAGDKFMIGLASTTQSYDFLGSSGAYGQYDGGKLYYNGSVFFGGDQWDMGFRTIMEPALATPEPSTLISGGIAALAGLGYGSRRRRAKAAA